MKAGEIEFDTGGHWLMGGFALISMFDWINEVRIPDDLRSQTIKLLSVTKATLPQFAIDYPEGQLKYDVKQHSRFLTPNGPATVIDLEYSKPVSLDLRP
jgi:simple sugar transport system substrate-binding protein